MKVGGNVIPVKKKKKHWIRCKSENSLPMFTFKVEIQGPTACSQPVHIDLVSLVQSSLIISAFS